MLTPLGLSALETACGLAFGAEPERPLHGRPLPSPAVALIEALAEPLRRPPCVVAFSGGRDSSLLLAAALVAARRENLPPPLPVTLRFPGEPESEESAWQERVIAHLAVSDWVRIELSDGLDIVGAVAQRALVEYGPLFPVNAHLVAPMLPYAAGGTIISGLGGDELFGLWRRRHLADVASGREPPRPSDVARLAGLLAPPRVRVIALRRRGLIDRLPWLRPAAQATIEETLAQQRAYATWRWDRHVLGVPRWRSMMLAIRDIGRVAAMGGATFGAPLLDERFVAALAAAGGWRGFGGRTATLRALFSDLLPQDVLERRHKATFNDAFITAEARGFAQEWSGRGLDASVVDPEVLRQGWVSSFVDYRSMLLLQSAWCHDHAVVRC